MTLLVAGLSLLISLSLSGFTVALGGGATARVRAQTAADAAALAVVAESTHYGSNRGADAARRFAALNGATLLECICDPGATAAQVRVEVDGVTAEARAVFDPVLAGPAAPVADGLHPLVAASVRRIVAASGGSVFLVSGYRSSERQAQLWADALRRYGSPEAADDWVAPPGHSMHERGLAVDLGGDLAAAAAIVEDLGLPLHRPLAHEPWHFELIGSRP